MFSRGTWKPEFSHINEPGRVRIWLYSSVGGGNDDDDDADDDGVNAG